MDTNTDNSDNQEQSTLKIICRNCSESFLLPDKILTQKDFPCPKCAFINHINPPGMLSLANILAKLGMIVGYESEVNEHTAYKSRIKGGIALALAFIIVVIYSLFKSQLF